MKFLKALRWFRAFGTGKSTAAVAAEVALDFAVGLVADAVFPYSLAATFWTTYSFGCGV